MLNLKNNFEWNFHNHLREATQKGNQQFEHVSRVFFCYFLLRKFFLSFFHFKPEIILIKAMKHFSLLSRNDND